MFFGTTESTVEEENLANSAPVFQDADRNTPGMQDEMVTREIAEDAGDGENIGDAFEATDMGDLLMFELGGADADSFGLSKPATRTNSVYLQTKAALDYETKSEYTVTITAKDSTGAPDTITVTVMVTDVNEGADIEGDDMATFAENGEGAVATFTATDPEGDAITWKLAGAKGVDNADFEIGEDTGVLTFASSPNFESPTDRDEDTSVIPAGVKDNMYKVSITANDGDAFVLTVEVENEDEPGTVSLDKPQPQVGRSIAAIDFDDPDGTDEKSVAWFSGPSDTGPWTDLEVTNESYAPVVADEGNYLRVVYTYNDKFGDGKTAEAVSDKPVEERTVSNAAPDFGTIDDIEVSENVDGVIGEIAATDDDNDDLLYSLADAVDDGADANDNDRFLHQLVGRVEPECGAGLRADWV